MAKIDDDDDDGDDADADAYCSSSIVGALVAVRSPRLKKDLSICSFIMTSK